MRDRSEKVLGNQFLGICGTSLGEARLGEASIRLGGPGSGGGKGSLFFPNRGLLGAGVFGFLFGDFGTVSRGCPVIPLAVNAERGFSL